MKIQKASSSGDCAKSWPTIQVRARKMNVSGEGTNWERGLTNVVLDIGNHGQIGL